MSSSLAPPKRVEEILAAVSDRPGLDTTQLSALLGQKMSYLYLVLPGLADEGRLERQGDGWFPVGYAPNVGYGAMKPVQSIAVIYERPEKAVSDERARADRNEALMELGKLTPTWATRLDRSVDLAETTAYAQTFAAEARRRDRATDYLLTLADDGIVQRPLYGELLHTIPSLTPEHVVCVSHGLSHSETHQWPEWGSSVAGEDFTRAVLSLVEERDDDHAFVYLFDLTVAEA